MARLILPSPRTGAIHHLLDFIGVLSAYSLYVDFSFTRVHHVEVVNMYPVYDIPIY